MAHYEGTAEEIYSQCCGKIDMFVAGAGTGGTIAGIGKRLKELIPTIEVIIALRLDCCHRSLWLHFGPAGIFES